MAHQTDVTCRGHDGSVDYLGKLRLVCGFPNHSKNSLFWGEFHPFVQILPIEAEYTVVFGTVLAVSKGYW